jgi:hypothetical protein
VSKEVVMAKDKLATNLYTLLAQEATWAHNLAQYLHHLKVNRKKQVSRFQHVPHGINTWSTCSHNKLKLRFYVINSDQEQFGLENNCRKRTLHIG